MNQEITSYNSDLNMHIIPFESFLTEAEKEKIYQTSNVVDYSKRDTILKQNARGQDIPVVLSGLVKLSREMRKGKNIILRIAQPASLLGLASVFGSDTYEYSAIALEPTTIRFINLNTFKEIVKDNGALGLEIIKLLSTDSIFINNRLSSLLYKQLPGRVADIILYFSEDIFRSTAFSIPLTRQELAELAGTTKESLIRTLSEFKHDKIIDMNRNYFSINSMNIIKTLSRLG